MCITDLLICNVYYKSEIDKLLIYYTILNVNICCFYLLGEEMFLESSG